MDGVEVNGYTIEPGAFLYRADLTGANLYIANLGGANLREANLTAARAGEGTTWPEGFDPKVAGVTFG